MTRMKSIAALGCTALAAALAVYGCGSSSTIDNGAGGGSSGTGGKTGGGTGGGVVIINTGGMTGSGGMTGGGVGGMTAGGMGGRIVQPPMDGGPAVCAQNNACTGQTMCDGTCNRNGQTGTRTCTCTNGRYNCGNCMVADAGAPPPPVDAGPRPDAGPACPQGTMNRSMCTVGTSPSPCTRGAGNNMQTCICAVAPRPDAGAVDAGPDAGAPPPPVDRYTCM
jgi:hypothetical protein